MQHRTLALLIVAFGLPLASFSETAQEGTPPGIAVLPLSLTAGPRVTVSPETINALVSHNLEETKDFTLVERERVSDLLKEARFQNSGLIKDETAVELGKLLGVRYVVLSSCTAEAASSQEVLSAVTGLNALAVAMNAYAASKQANSAGQTAQTGPAAQTTVATQTIWRTTYSVDLRIVEVETGMVAHRLTATGAGRSTNQVESASQAFGSLQDSLRRSFVNEFPLSGYVLEAKGPKVLVIDAGKDRGVRIGDRFTLFRRAPDRIHPVTGMHILGEKLPQAEFEVVQVDESVSVLKRRGSGPDSVSPGWQVERCPRKADPGGRS